MTDEKKHNQSSPDQPAQANGSANASRRKALKTAGVAGGLAAGGIWHKPVVNAVALPAHAETSPSGPAALSGPTSDAPLDTSVNFGGDSGVEIVDGLVDLVMPAAHAAVGSPPGTIRVFFGQSRFRHCVSLDFPDGPAPSAPVNITVQGPTAHYAYQYSYYNYPNGYCTGYGFNEDWDMNGFASTTLNGLDFEYDFGDFMVTGCITDSDFSGAAGYLTYTSCSNSTSGIGYYLCGNDTATFSLSPTGSCNVGSGNLSDLQSAYTGNCPSL